jgi:hypothetical protein
MRLYLDRFELAWTVFGTLMGIGSPMRRTNDLGRLAILTNLLH